jgi:hypothetical protein
MRFCDITEDWVLTRIPEEKVGEYALAKAESKTVPNFPPLVRE